ncbi:aspartate-semialdehyde dehydrogenase [Pelagicoccus sp. SDUM812003]|uniref:aspartate-semialdehyde dehydrogenase n=1 Tax=Pelagicoccus sp. SDUM812003 TaxID=3041267 RepID=UPI00280CE39F|nr:aspartate-semialdehyde dehydrogenase [Pelagicoccus sp. SDUM812003]MDQ8205085.1 aspartate-semialdehyde dehydrogenase [Pelagicoccus sp. SDUM812003]
MGYKVGIVGATGAVGQEFIKLLGDREFPLSELKLFASARSAGKQVEALGQTITIEEATETCFEGLDFVLFSASGTVSKALCPAAAKAGAVAIDNSSAFRMDPDVPLVVPEINGEAAKSHKGIIANPNCSTAISLMGAYPLHKAFGLKRMFASTYQAVSGTGAEAMQELEDQLKAWAKGEEVTHSVYPYQIAFNALPHVDAFLEDGYTKEEMKMLNEGRKIMSLPELKVSCTCVRVPVMRSHSISINAEFERPVSVEEARKAIAAFPGVDVVDDPANKVYPMPLDYAGKVNCGVGRIRKDSAFENGLAFWVVGDQLWKGAALNAIQIAEHLIK